MTALRGAAQTLAIVAGFVALFLLAGVACDVHADRSGLHQRCADACEAHGGRAWSAAGCVRACECQDGTSLPEVMTTHALAAALGE